MGEGAYRSTISPFSFSMLGWWEVWGGVFVWLCVFVCKEWLVDFLWRVGSLRS